MRFASALHYVILLVFCAFTTVSASSAKAQKLSKLSQSSRNGVVRLNAASFNEYVGPNIPRDYSISVVFNALKPAQGCAPCGLFQREYDLLATQWTRKRPDKKGVPHFFAMVEFTEAQRLFQSLGLQTAPTTRFYPPTQGPESTNTKPFDEYDVRTGASAAVLSRWITAHKKGVSFTYTPPVDYTIAFSVVALSSMAGFILWRKFAQLKPFLTGRYLWATATILFIIVMNSGFMWTRIRQTPYMSPGGGMIAQGHQNQFGIEVHIMAALYSFIAISVGVLLFALPKVSDPITQRVGVYVWVFIYVNMHIVLVALFKSKNPAYPFSYLLW